MQGKAVYIKFSIYPVVVGASCIETLFYAYVRVLAELSNL